MRLRLHFRRESFAFAFSRNPSLFGYAIALLLKAPTLDQPGQAHVSPDPRPYYWPISIEKFLETTYFASVAQNLVKSRSAKSRISALM